MAIEKETQENLVTEAGKKEKNKKIRNEKKKQQQQENID